MIRRFLTLAALLWLLAGCSALNRQKPELNVTVNSFSMEPGNGMVPRFRIGLHLVNTSPVDVNIKGVVYKIYLDGRKVLTGAANDLPEVPAYGEADITVTGTPDIFETLGFFKDMMSKRNGTIDYVVDVSVDAGSFIPMIHTKKEGKLSLNGK
jgi:LEA14-like dessication related protein